jgi:putative endonuclease
MAFMWFARFLSLLRIRPESPDAWGERIAAKHLRRQGYRILARNISNAHGEIDVLAEAPDGRTIVVVEVKSSLPESHADNPRPEVRVNEHKQRKLAALAMQLVRRYKLQDRPVRFDVVGVDLPRKGEQPVVRHHVGAFESRW